MNLRIAFLALTFLALVGCTKQAATVTPPTGTAAPSGLVIALDVVEVGCAAAVPDVSTVVAAWLATCPGIVSTTTTALASGNPSATVSIIVAGFNNFLKAAPLSSVGVTSKDVQIINSITAAVQAFLVIYNQQVASASVVPAFAVAFLPPARWHASEADKKQLKATRRHAAETAKKLKARKK
jgi:hypothetical protein